MCMQLHEAIRYARLEKKLSQKKLSAMAGIQRRQLATLESGGNVTLATVRKVLAQLSNLETFTLETVSVNVASEPPPPPDQKRFGETMELMARALGNLSKRIQEGQYPTPEDAAALHEVNVRLLADLPPVERAVVLGKKAPDFAEEIEAAIAERDGKQ